MFSILKKALILTIGLEGTITQDTPIIDVTDATSEQISCVLGSLNEQKTYCSGESPDGMNTILYTTDGVPFSIAPKIDTSHFPEGDKDSISQIEPPN